MQPRESTPPPIAIGRVATRDLVMKVRLDDAWHRLVESGMETACGLYVDLRLIVEMKNERQFTWPLADKCGCWHGRELERAAQEHRKQYPHRYEGEP